VTRAAVIAAVVVALGASTGCASRWIPEATEADAARVSARWPGTTAADLNRGRSLLLAHCGNCHLPPSPAEHDAAAWSAEVGEMRARSALTVIDAHLVERYLAAFASDRTPSAH
jgi:cytochrome c5